MQLGVHAPTRKAYALKTQNVAGDIRLRRNIDREIEAMRAGASPFLMRFYGEIEEVTHFACLTLACSPSLPLSLSPCETLRSMQLWQGGISRMLLE